MVDVSVAMSAIAGDELAGAVLADESGEAAAVGVVLKKYPSTSSSIKNNRRPNPCPWLNTVHVAFAAFVLCVGITIFVVTFVSNRDSDEELAILRIRTDAEFVASDFHALLQTHIDNIEDIAALATGKEYPEMLTREKFNAISASAIGHLPGVQSYVFCEYTTHADRPYYEARETAHWRAVGNNTRDYPIKTYEIVPGQPWPRMYNASFYYPIRYRYPVWSPFVPLINLDVFSDQTGNEKYITYSVENKVSVITQKTWLQNTRAFGFILIAPTASADVGIVRAIVVLPEMFSYVLRTVPRTLMKSKIWVFDTTYDPLNPVDEKTFLYGVELNNGEIIQSYSSTEDYEGEFETSLKSSDEFEVFRELSINFQVANREIQIIFIVSDFDQVNSSGVWSQIIIMTCFVCLAAFYLFQVRYQYYAQKEIQRASHVALNKVLAYICHELRNPIHAIQNLASEISTPAGDETSKDNLTMLKASTSLLYDLINGLMDSSKLDVAETIKLKPQLVVIAEVLRDCFHRYRVISRSNAQVEWVLDVPDNLANIGISMDKLRFRQILSNGLSNAMKYTAKGKIVVSLERLPQTEMEETVPEPPGTPSNKSSFLRHKSVPNMKNKPVKDASVVDIADLNVDVEEVTSQVSSVSSFASNSKGQLVIRITDSGFGLSKQFLEDGLFKEYQQDHQSQQHTDIASTGLGLPIARLLAELMGCKLKVKNRSDNVTGCVFSLYFPYGCNEIETRISLNPNDNDQNAITAGENLRGIASEVVEGLTIFACEDDPIVQLILRKMLKKVNSTQIFDDGQDLLEYLDNNNYKCNADVILLDIVMKRSVGDAICVQLRKRKVNCVIIAVTGNSTAADHDTYMNAGFDEVLLKPYNKEDLFAAIHKTWVNNQLRSRKTPSGSSSVLSSS